MKKRTQWKLACATAVTVLSGAVTTEIVQASELEVQSKEYNYVLTCEGIRESLPEQLKAPFKEWLKAQEMIAVVAEQTEEIALFTIQNSLEGTLVYANVFDYVNIRKGPSTDYECVGKLYANAVAEVVSIEGEWALVTSGDVDGYIKSEYLLFGEEAQEAIRSTYKTMLKVTCDILNLRSGEGTNYSILGKLKEGTYCELLSETEEWAKVQVNGTTGYVSKEYVQATQNFKYAISAEEEARIAEEKAKAEAEAEAARKAAAEAEAARKAAEAAKAAEEAKKQQEKNAASLELGQRIADYAVQFVGNPYVWGGTSLTNGADCSGFVYAVYRDFGYTLVRSSRDQASCSSYRSITPNATNLQPGDLVFYATSGVVDHVALYIGNGKVVQASTPKDGIVISKYNYRTPHSAKRVL